MLMNIDCSAVTSIKVKLTFDDGTTKERVVALGDIIQVEFNGNGKRRRAEGKVIAVNANGTDPKGWYIIVDSSDDFDSKKARFAPTNILDVEILRKADTTETIRTPLGAEGIPFLALKNGQLVWSKDGYDWRPVRIHNRYIIEDAEGSGIGDHGNYEGEHRPHRPQHNHPNHFDPPSDDYPSNDYEDGYDDNVVNDEDVIEESSY